ncbi:MAG TPA: M43 family zinc metalloprotease [Chitinophagales bacterium]|nr:M43 family zinc metalloprotease [Chitinophagales bacterium]
MISTPFRFLFLILLCCSFLPAAAQEVDRCGTQQMLEQYELQQPGTKEAIRQTALEAREWVKNNPTSTRSIITIPVVVHVIYKTSAQNISDEQIQSQIDVLNEDFLLSNPDTSKIPDEFRALAADCQIQFCLAAYDPDGDSTTGIVRTFTEKSVFTTGDSMKFTSKGGDDAWPAKNYLNIWTCNLGGGVLGYATPPQGNSGTSKSDGVVVLYRAFGRQGTVVYPYNEGRTCTHEVGHWLGLSHIWGDDGGTCSNDDDIADTPLQADSNYGCPQFPLTDFCSPAAPGVMFMNYMDYTDDRCMYMFTKGQSAVMTASLNGVRKTILTSPAGCQGVYFSDDASVSKVIYAEDTVCFLSFTPQVQLTNRGSNTLTSADVYYKADGQDPAVYHYSGNLSTGQSEVINFQQLYFTSEGDHIATAWSALPNNQQDQFVFNDSAENDFSVISCVEKNSFDAGPSPTAGPVMISIENPSAGEMDLRVINWLGQVVQHHFLKLNTQSSVEIDLSDLAPGMYILYSKIGYDYVRQKVMVMR